MSVKPGPLLYGQYYHIYTHGNNSENLFIEHANYDYFLALYAKYIPPVADTYAYCLMGNHFHFLVRIKTEEEQALSTSESNFKARLPSQQFSNLLNAYAKAMNQRYQRSGSLFQSRFGRKIILNDQYMAAVIAYIHRNPQHHRFVSDFRDWPYSSYHTLLSDKPTQLNRTEALAWFDSPEKLIGANLDMREQQFIQPLFSED